MRLVLRLEHDVTPEGADALIDDWAAFAATLDDSPRSYVLVRRVMRDLEGQLARAKRKAALAELQREADNTPTVAERRRP